MSLAAPTIYVAVDVALLADSAYMALVVDRGVYAAGDVPDNQRLSDGGSRVGYLEIGSSTETTDEQESFEADAASGVLTLTVRATSKRWALILARHVRRVLHRTPLTAALSTITGESQWLIEGEVQFVEDFANPDGGHSCVLSYLTSTISTA
jgi:hypothetical protein